MQKKVKEFNEIVIQYHKIKMNVASRVMNIISEMGELSKEILKSTKYGTKEFSSFDDFKMEMGDVIYAILSLCDEVGINAEECLDISIEKMKGRLIKNNNLASGN